MILVCAVLTNAVTSGFYQSFAYKRILRRKKVPALPDRTSTRTPGDADKIKLNRAERAP